MSKTYQAQRAEYAEDKDGMRIPCRIVLFNFGGEEEENKKHPEKLGYPCGTTCTCYLRQYALSFMLCCAVLYCAELCVPRT
jgi:hypothetical protein